jgi:CRISPR-associated protein (TIGR03984 family)
MKRDILTLNPKATCRRIPMDDFANDPIAWLSRKMQDHQLKYLLAHADDGVIWGRLDDQELITSHHVAQKHSPQLRIKTLLTVRIFAPSGELLVWHDEDGKWAGRLIADEIQADATASWDKAFEEKQILLGTKAEPLGRGFALMSEGSQGLFHAAPLNRNEPIDEQKRPLRLIVRHYLKADNYGFMRVNASRLKSLLDLEESNI